MMGYPTDRVILYDPNGLPLGDLGKDEILSRIRKEELNGEHSLTIVTTRIINSGSRVLTCDGSGKWREYVVTEPDEEHSSGKAAIGTYRCTWSMQSDLTATAGGVLWASATDGTNEPISAQQALSIALTNSPCGGRGRATSRRRLLRPCTTQACGSTCPSSPRTGRASSTPA